MLIDQAGSKQGPGVNLSIMAEDQLTVVRVLYFSQLMMDALLELDELAS